MCTHAWECVGDYSFMFTHVCVYTGNVCVHVCAQVCGGKWVCTHVCEGDCMCVHMCVEASSHIRFCVVVFFFSDLLP